MPNEHKSAPPLRTGASQRSALIILKSLPKDRQLLHALLSEVVSAVKAMEATILRLDFQSLPAATGLSKDPNARLRIFHARVENAKATFEAFLHGPPFRSKLVQYLSRDDLPRKRESAKYSPP